MQPRVERRRANYRSRRGAKGRARQRERRKNEFTTIRSFYRRARPSAIGEAFLPLSNWPSHHREIVTAKTSISRDTR